MPPQLWRTANSNSSLENDRLVTIVAGQKSYKVQRAALVNASTWFEKALNPSFKEGNESLLRFPGTATDVVEHFLQWLFQGRLPTEWTELVYRQYEHEHSDLLVGLWLFGDRHFLLKLQDDAMRQLHDSCGGWSPPSFFHDIFRIAPKDSPLRKLAVD